MFVKIKSIEILPNFKIKALFDCNVVKTYDFNALIKNHKAFKDLQQESLFKQAKVDCGGYGICWTDDIDIDSGEIWYNGATELKADEDIFNYIKAVIQESEPENIIKAIQEVAKIKGYNNLAEKMGVGRESLYKSLSGATKPRFETIYKILLALGLRLSIKPAEA